MGDEAWPQYAIELQAERSRVSRELDEKGRLLRSIDTVLQAKPDEMFAVLRVDERAEGESDPYSYVCDVALHVGVAGAMEYRDGSILLTGDNVLDFNTQAKTIVPNQISGPIILECTADYKSFELDSGLLVWNGVIPVGYLDELDMTNTYDEVPPGFLIGKDSESVAVVVGNNAVRKVFGVEDGITGAHRLYCALLANGGAEDAGDHAPELVSRLYKGVVVRFYQKGFFEMSGLQNDVGYWREQSGVNDVLTNEIRRFHEATR